MRDASQAIPLIALAGNPNAGKTTLFNALTGLGQKVANYPGVTVERKEGSWTIGDQHARLIDLPGLYSLDATSIDEHIASDVLRGEVAGLPKPDAVIAAVDATNLERNLYLVTQLFEYNVPIIIALTMIDVFEKQQHEIDIDKLSASLGVPVVAVNASADRGIEDLSDAVSQSLTNPQTPKLSLNGDGDNARIFARYNFISNALQESVVHNDQAAHGISEKIDRILTHKIFGLVILVGILLVVFQTIFTWATVPMDLLEQG
ncbi:MAG: FeoB small GTPase domain-containing protein, partial [Pyrinomonadaceae bacterium]